MDDVAGEITYLEITVKLEPTVSADIILKYIRKGFKCVCVFVFDCNSNDTKNNDETSAVLSGRRPRFFLGCCADKGAAADEKSDKPFRPLLENPRELNESEF